MWGESSGAFVPDDDSCPARCDALGGTSGSLWAQLVHQSYVRYLTEIQVGQCFADGEQAIHCTAQM